MVISTRSTLGEGSTDLGEAKTPAVHKPKPIKHGKDTVSCRLRRILLLTGVIFALPALAADSALEFGTTATEFQLELSLKDSLDNHILKAPPSLPLRKATQTWVRTLQSDLPTDLSYLRRSDGLFQIASTRLLAGAPESRICISLHGILDLSCQVSYIRGLDYAQQSADGKPARIGTESTSRIERISRVDGNVIPNALGDRFTLEARGKAKTIRTTESGSKIDEREYGVLKTCDVIEEKSASEIAKEFHGRALIVRCTESTTGGSTNMPAITILRAFLVESALFITLQTESSSKVQYSYSRIEYNK